MATKGVFVSGSNGFTSLLRRKKSLTSITPSKSKPPHPFILVTRASLSQKHHVYKQLGFFALKKKIEDAVLRAEMLAPTALEVEEARWIKQEEMIRECDLWDDPVKSDKILVKFGYSAKVVDALKDLKFKAEEAKLISQLAEMEAINYELFSQAYSSSIDFSKFLDQYEMSNLLKGPYDFEGASVIIKSGDIKSEVWVEQLVSMYLKWAEKLGYKGRVVEKHPAMSGGLKSVTIEFEFECAYGYLSGERGVHNMISENNRSSSQEVTSACMDVIPLFLGTALDYQIEEDDLIVSTTPVLGTGGEAVCLQHIPSGVSFQSSGERSHIANKLKALNRLKAKLLVIATEQKLSSISNIQKDTIDNVLQQEARRYVSHPYKQVHDVRTGMRLPDTNHVLDGNIEPLIAARLNSKHTD